MGQFYRVFCPCGCGPYPLGRIGSELWDEMDEETREIFLHDQGSFLIAYWDSIAPGIVQKEPELRGLI